MNNSRSTRLAWMYSMALGLLLLVDPSPAFAQKGLEAKSSQSPGSQTREVDSTETPSNAKKDDVPPPLETYMGRRIADYMGYEGAPWLIRETRELEENPSVVLEQLGLKPGMVVCDLGCGNGFYTLAMAQKVAPGGKVLAVDIQPEMLQLLSRRSAETKLDNIDMVLSTVINPNLPDNSIDLLLLVDVYHEFSHPVHMLSAIRKSLKKDGVIALVEFRGEDPRVQIKPLHKMTKKQILKEYRANGFKLVKEFDGLPIQHLMFFGVDADWVQRQQK